LIREVFTETGPDIAYLDSPKILEMMSPEAQQLFLGTVTQIFPYRQFSDRWIYVGEGTNARQIPDTDRIMAPFQRQRQRRLASYSDVRARVGSGLSL